MWNRETALSSLLSLRMLHTKLTKDSPGSLLELEVDAGQTRYTSYRSPE